MGCKHAKVYDGKKDNKKIEGRAASSFHQALVQEHNEGVRIDDVYAIEWDDNKALGSGATSTVRMCTHKVSGEVYALKTIELNRLTTDMRKSLLTEVEIMKQLDHPNIIKLLETYVDFHRLYIIMECCTGGELFDKLYEQPNNRFTEAECVNMGIKMVSSLKYLHDNNIFHRDLKLENFIFTRKDGGGEIKMIDFGMSLNYLEGQNFNSTCGTCYYMAPEVIDKSVPYTEACDMWSMGVIMYMLLSGIVPFGGRTDEEIQAKALVGKYSFLQKKWTGISEKAKSFVSDLLVKDPTKRMTATDALKHAFLHNNTDSSIKHTDSEVLEKAEQEIHCITNLKQFKKFGLFKRAALAAIAFTLGENEISKMRDTFHKLDVEKNGVITYEEFQIVMHEHGVMEDTECKRIFAAMDQDHMGVVKYSEFLAACVDEKTFSDEKRMLDAFNRLDIDKSGTISRENLKTFLGDIYSEEAFERLFAEVDEDKTGEIKYHEFKKAVACQ